jgi:periplasmic protein CpxP/Spy
MKSRVFLIPALFCAGLLSTIHTAQAQSPQAKLEHLAKELKLTPQQKVQMLPILETEGPKVEAVRGDPSLTKLQKLEQLKAIHDQTDPQVKSILNPGQYQKLQEIRQKDVEQAIKKKKSY